MNKALVTGGAGFLGSHLVDKLLDLGYYVISVDNYFAGKKENLIQNSDNPNFEEVECDVLDYDKLDSLFVGVDYVFHQAASKKTICLNNPRLDLDINAKGTFNLLELSVKHKVKKFVHGSTGSVYGEPIYFPQDEKHPLNPTSYYGVSKLAGERYVNAFNHLYDLDTTILRYFHIYGPRQESSDVGGVVSIFSRNLLQNTPTKIFGDGTQERSFTYVDDVVKANINAAKSSISNGKVYNCASGIKITINDLYFMLKDILKVENHKFDYFDWTPGDIKKFEINNHKIINDLELDFITDFKQGLEKTVGWANNYFKNV
jgi:nucleoside-diphosphate-sugar epimerase